MKEVMNQAVVSVWLQEILQQVFQQNSYDLQLLPQQIMIERPRNKSHGDYSTNVALQRAKALGLTPLELAKKIRLEMQKDTKFTNVTVAKPGFINFSLGTAEQNQILHTIFKEKHNYGASIFLTGQIINLEFVSANPTGPIHLGGARWAAVGDSLSRILNFQGAKVTKEYYFNDHGTQIDRFVSSLLATAKNEPVPEDGYVGEYIKEIAGLVLENNPNIFTLPVSEQREIFRAQGVELMFKEIKESLLNFRVEFDVYTHENGLFEDGTVEKAISILKKQDNLFNKEGAWWLKSTKFGDDKDRVVIKSNGEYSYLAGDIGYLLDKIQRGFTLCLIMLGADHHGYVGRLKAATAALGEDPAKLEILIGQLINLVKAGQPVKMSKRAGNIVTMDDLVEAVGVDAARYALVRSSVDVTLDIDLDLLIKSSNDNPVYYVQYAHARLASILRTSAERGLKVTNPQVDLLTGASEGELIRTLAQFPETIKLAGENREPNRIARYLEMVATALHRFYAESRVLPGLEEEFTALHAARLFLCINTKQVLANGLALLGITAPEQM